MAVVLALAVLLGRTRVARFFPVVEVICGGGRVMASTKGRVAHINVSIGAGSLVSSGKGVGVGAVSKASAEVIKEVSGRVRLGASTRAGVSTVLM